MRLRHLRHLVMATSVIALTAPTASITASAGEPSAGDREVRVMSFNIHHGAGVDGVLDLQRIADVIESEQADVVGLQEVDRHWSERSDFVDQTAWLARELNMHAVYGANLDLDPAEPGQERRQYGTAILSKSPILDWENTFLPRFEDHEQRGLLRAKVNVRGVPLQVYNTHLQHNDAEERLAQVNAIKGLIGTPDESVALVGDLNATPDAPEIEAITEDLIDAWEAAGEGDGYTYPTEDPEKRIDYVLTSDDVIAKSVTVVSTDSSDHLPLHADILLPGSNVGIGNL